MSATLAPAATALHRVAVRELCEFTAKRGDLDLRFTPAPSATEGMVGHATVATRRGAGYAREVKLEGRYAALRVCGRADGVLAQPLAIEEIKTYRGDLQRQPGNHRELHWAQLKIYGALLVAERGLAEVQLRLTYFQVDTEQETTLVESFTAESLGDFFAQQCDVYLQWHRAQQAHRHERDGALAALSFPHARFHAGQRQMAEAVYRGIAGGHCLLAQAPTGIGKSVGSLFPALKGMAVKGLDKVIYLTAKTSGRQAALDALATLQTATTPLPLRALELVAREKACEHPDKACHGESCPLAKGFYDRLPAARSAAMQTALQDQQGVRSVALAHQICPYYLSQELARWADVIVCDYNYYFDRSAFVHALSQLNDWKTALLIDEAHNLVERGRAMYSAELDQAALAAVRRQVPPSLRRFFGGLQRALQNLGEQHPDEYSRLAELPERCIEALHRLVVKLGEHFNANPAQLEPALQRCYFDALQFLGLAEVFGEHSICDVQNDPDALKPRLRLCIRNIVPGRFLAPRFASAQSTAAFSATLNPADYYLRLLGLPASTQCLDVPSPFTPEQLDVRLAAHIDTRFRQRQHSLLPIARRMASQFLQQPGNYLAFFSSYAYLAEVYETLHQLHPEIPLCAQERQMSEGARQTFLQRFTPEGQLLGFAVLGGAFSEGVDLPGRRLLGVFVATLGLPQVNPVNAAISLRMGELFGTERAYDYTYLYPGLQKVVQAAGRVIRSTDDRGVVVLMDERFALASVRRLLPQWWQPRADERAQLNA